MDSPFSSSSPLSTTSTRPPRPKVTAGAFMALLPALIGGVLVGVIYHFIARFLDLLIVFPLAAGVIAGMFVVSLAKKNKVRSKPALAIIGVLTGLLCYGAKEFSDSLHYRSMLLPAIAEEMAAQNGKSAAVNEASLRAAFPPLAFFPHYLEDAAEQGISISSTHSMSSKGAPIKGKAYWALFILEGFLVVGSAAGVAIAQASKPFCEPCDQWYTDDLRVTRLHPNQAEEALKLLQSKDFTGLGNMRSENTDEKTYADVTLTKCNGCGVGRVKLATTQNNKTKVLWEGDPTPQEIKTLEEVRSQRLK